MRPIIWVFVLASVARLPRRPRPFARMTTAFLALLLCHAPTPAAATRGFAAGTPWQRIEYPAISIPGTDHDQMQVRVSSGGSGAADGEPRHLRFDLQWGAMMPDGRTPPPLPAPIADEKTISATLHTSDRTYAATNLKDVRWVGVSNAGGVTEFLVFLFPWGRNALDEAWIEMRAAGRTYWIELPYGFARNPDDPELPDRTRGAPVFSAVMAQLGDRDVLVPWVSVSYDLGPLPNGSRLSLTMENHGDARAKTTLSYDPTRGRPPFTLETPRVTAEIQVSDRTVLAGRETARLLDPRRSIFEFTRHSTRMPTRLWGTVVIDVDGHRTTQTVPSSLFSLLHGVTDPGNPHRMPVPPVIR
jgi:hypothetical protein